MYLVASKISLTDGEAVSRDVEQYGAKSLSWYTPETSAAFMEDATRAWNLVSAAKTYFDKKTSDAHKPIATIYKRDSRAEKNSSTAYFRAFRQSLADNDAFAARLARTVQYDLGVLLAAIEIDFPGRRVADNLEDVASDNTCAYLAVLRELLYRDDSVTKAFCSTQMMRAEQADDKLLFAVSLLLVDLSTPERSWDCIQDKVKYFPEIIWAFEKRLRLARDNGVMLSEAKMPCSKSALLREVKTLGYLGVDLPSEYRDRVESLIADVCRNNGVKIPDYFVVEPLDADGIEQSRNTVQTYLAWVQNRHVPTQQDLTELIELLQVISPDGSNFETMIRVRYRYIF